MIDIAVGVFLGGSALFIVRAILDAIADKIS